MNNIQLKGKVRPQVADNPDGYQELFKELSQLIETLKLELLTGEKLLKSSVAQKLAIKKADLNKLNTATEHSNDLLGKLMDLEDERIRILLDISSKLGIPLDKLTICELISQIGKKGIGGIDELSLLRQKLASVFQKLMTTSRINQYLITRSLGFVEDRIRVINYAMNRADTYSPIGKEAVKLDPTSGGVIVNRQV